MILIGFWVFQVHFSVCNIEVATEDHRASLNPDGFTALQDSDTELKLESQARVLPLRIGEIRIDQRECFEICNEDASLRIQLRNP